jgi:TrmH family RNA methyltransferase
MRSSPISSRSNPWFARFRRAIDEHDQEVVIEGPKQVADAIAGGWEAIAIAGETMPERLEAGVTRLSMSPSLLKALSGTVRHQGTFGLFRKPARSLDDVFDRVGIIVVLDGVQDPGNVGTIIRLSAAFEAAGVAVTPDSADPYGPKSVRATSGTLFLLPVAVASREAILEACRRRKLPLYAAAGDGSRQVIPPGPAVVAFGSEGRGVSAELRAAATGVGVPISPTVESLNVAAAAAIILHQAYELRR